MSASWVTFLFEAANFLLLAAVLGWLFFRPVRDALEKRRAALEEERGAAARVHAEAAAALEEARAARAEAERAGRELREAAAREAEAAKQQLLEAAQAEALRERERLAEELAAARRSQALASGRDAAFAAREIVVRLLEQLGGPELEAALQRAACRSLEKLRSSGTLAPVTVESARELDDAALRALATAAGVGREDVAQRVEADLVAGVRVLTARGLVDLSAAGLGEGAERVLVSRLEHEDGS